MSRLRRRVSSALVLGIILTGCSTRKDIRVPISDLRKSLSSNAPEVNFQLGTTTWHLVRIPPGEFIMGSPPNEPGRAEWEVPARRVRITRAFYLGKFEVTQAQFRKVMDTNPSQHLGEDLPVDDVNFADALKFCERLSATVGVTVTLPTEAQWEYACRAGTTTPYYSGATEQDLGRIAWYARNSQEKTHPGGGKEPNAWGLYDMLGNVAEPCIDYILSFDKLSSNDPEGKRSQAYGALRGGAWMDTAERSRAAYRVRTRDMLAGMGIRIAINPD